MVHISYELEITPALPDPASDEFGWGLAELEILGRCERAIL